MSIQVGDKVRILNHDPVNEDDYRGPVTEAGYQVGDVVTVYRLADGVDRLIGAPEGAFFASAEGHGVQGLGFTPNNVEVIERVAA